MKAKLLFIMAFLFLGMGVSFGQKIKKKEIDKFTKNEIIETSTETLYAVNFMASGWIYRFEFQLRRVNGEYSMPANILMQEMVKYTEDDGQSWTSLSPDTVVSMNLWGFMPDIFEFIEKGFKEFLKTNINLPKSEYYLPTVVSSLIDNGQKNVEVLVAEDKWYGITYKEDKQKVVNAIGAMIDAGIYENM